MMDVKQEEVGRESAPSRTSPERSADKEKERGSADPESFDDIGDGSDAFKNLPQIKADADAQAALKKQGLRREVRLQPSPWSPSVPYLVPGVKTRVQVRTKRSPWLPGLKTRVPELSARNMPGLYSGRGIPKIK